MSRKEPFYQFCYIVGFYETSLSIQVFYALYTFKLEKKIYEACR